MPMRWRLPNKRCRSISPCSNAKTQFHFHFHLIPKNRSKSVRIEYQLTCICENECCPMLRCELNPYSRLTLSKSCGFESESSSAVSNWRKKRWKTKTPIKPRHKLSIPIYICCINLQENSNDSFIILIRMLQRIGELWWLKAIIVVLMRCSILNE